MHLSPTPALQKAKVQPYTYQYGMPAPTCAAAAEPGGGPSGLAAARSEFYQPQSAILSASLRVVARSCLPLYLTPHPHAPRSTRPDPRGHLLCPGLRRARRSAQALSCWRRARTAAKLASAA